MSVLKCVRRNTFHRFDPIELDVQMHLPIYAD